jgi:hypothetical protein
LPPQVQGAEDFLIIPWGSNAVESNGKWDSQNVCSFIIQTNRFELY